MPPHFAHRKKARTPVEILAHIGDLFDWAKGIRAGLNIGVLKIGRCRFDARAADYLERECRSQCSVNFL
jgi:hypothetical protein